MNKYVYTKTDRHGITTILLKMALNTITVTLILIRCCQDQDLTLLTYNIMYND